MNKRQTIQSIERLAYAAKHCESAVLATSERDDLLAQGYITETERGWGLTRAAHDLLKPATPPYFRPSEEDGSLSCPECAATFPEPTTREASAMVLSGRFDSMEDAKTKGALRAAQDHFAATHASPQSQDDTPPSGLGGA